MPLCVCFPRLQVYKCIQRDELSLASKEWLRISPAARELISGLLEKDPSKRYTLEQVRECPHRPCGVFDRILVALLVACEMRL